MFYISAVLLRPAGRRKERHTRPWRQNPRQKLEEDAVRIARSRAGRVTSADGAVDGTARGR
jgi:hypothetical protein